MDKQGYNLDYRVYIEGILCKFNSINTVTSPQGVEASINIPSNRLVSEIPPKTSVQVFYKDWFGSDRGWRLMFDGYTSQPYKVDQADTGRGFTIVCRDFRMDIRKLPAAYAFQPAEKLVTNFRIMGLHRTTTTTTGSKATETADDSGINDMAAMLKRIAGTAGGGGAGSMMDEFASVSEMFAAGGELPPGVSDQTVSNGFMLDAISRGVWADAVGASRHASYLNKRVRADKKMLIPVNEAGTRFWSAQASGLHVGQALMGGSQFSSIEAIIMRVAGIFATRPYSCPTPSLIELDEESTRMFIHPDVRTNLVVNNEENFGAPYQLNETMILPPLEFSAPPNCNIMFPAIYNRVELNFDMDTDFTRGHYDQIDSFDNDLGYRAGAQEGFTVSHHVPSVLSRDMNGSASGQGRIPLTLEERYKGINVHFDSVEYNLGKRDSLHSWLKTIYGVQTYAEIEEAIAAVERGATQDELDRINSAIFDDPLADPDMLARLTAKKAQLEANAEVESTTEAGVRHALMRHSIIKFMNAKYRGRMATVSMSFNPYIVPGFPGVIVSDSHKGLSAQTNKSVIGMVQVVKHLVVVNSQSCEASTTITMNNARFVDEPTDIGEYGDPLYLEPTNQEDARVNNQWDQKIIEEPYFVPEPVSKIEVLDDGSPFDYNELSMPNHKYVKDLASQSQDSYDRGERNILYIDPLYEPVRVGQFYQKLLKESKPHFMVGKNTEDDYFFVYNTMHEAIEKNLEAKAGSIDYETAMNLIRRNVCSADAFYRYILGASIKKKDADDNVYYEKEYESEEVPGDIHDEYFGITEDNEELGLVAGDSSSIRENTPITPFIKERKEAVKNYLALVKDDSIRSGNE